MLGLWITLGILALLLFLLLMPVAFSLDLDTPADTSAWKITWLGISWYASTGTGLLQRLPKRRRQTKKKPSQKPKKPQAQSQRSQWKRYWRLFREITAVVPKPLRRLWKGISIGGLVVGVRVGRFDAKDCALAYGAANAGVYTALGLLHSMMRVKVKQVQVQCAFGRDRMDWIIRGKLRVSPLATLLALVSLGVGYGKQKVSRSTPPEEKTQAQTQEYANASR